MVVLQAFGSAEDGCHSCDDVRASVLAEAPDGRWTVSLSGARDAVGEPLRLPPELVPVARQLVAEGVAALARLLPGSVQKPMLRLAAVGELQLWARFAGDQPGTIALVRRSDGKDEMVAAPRGADLFIALNRAERYLRQAGVLPPVPRAG